MNSQDDCCDLPETIQDINPVTVSQPGIPLLPPAGQRCRGRNYDGKRCCTPENPCDEGEGDCDGPGDGGQHDGHEGCKGDLVCGSNNCLQFGSYYHPKDDCCERPSLNTSEPRAESTTSSVAEMIFRGNVPTFFRPIVHRCAGRDVDQGRCCTEDQPCRHGEGDCDDDSECQQGQLHLPSNNKCVFDNASACKM